jgi:ABC-type glycerol-3-phosphate transport system substrate-binding protein
VLRAVHKGIQVLKQGLVRRIGTGEDTDLWNDQWLPRDGMLRPLACLKSEPPAKVADFIDATTASWKEDKLRQYMLPIDVETILQIPLSYRRHVDI